MSRRQPEGPPPPPVVQRIRLRYAKRGRLRFISHRDFARAFERALRRAQIPMAYTAGFSPRPRISYAGAASTGVASEAEYLEIALAQESDPEAVRAALDAVLPDGLDILTAQVADADALADLLQASRWEIVLPGVDPQAARSAVQVFLARDEVLVDRLMKDGRRQIDARAPVVSMRVGESGVPDVSVPEMTVPEMRVPDVRLQTGTQRGADAHGAPCAILDVVVRQVTPVVRPDDVLVALRVVAGLDLAQPSRATRLAYGPLDADGAVRDPFDRVLPGSGTSALT